jgi:hypothetical protein
MTGKGKNTRPQIPEDEDHQRLTDTMPHRWDLFLVSQLCKNIMYPLISCVLSVVLVLFNSQFWILKEGGTNPPPPVASAGVLTMLFIISQTIIRSAELTPRLICLLLWRFLNRQGCVNDTVHYLLPFWQALWRRDFLREELISIKAALHEAVPRWLGKLGIQNPGNLVPGPFSGQMWEQKWIGLI